MLKAILQGSEPISKRGAWLVLVVAALAFSTACVTVRPQQRAILADPLMRFDATAKQDAELQHVLDNREGSFGGGAVQGGGCGCN